MKTHELTVRDVTAGTVALSSFGSTGIVSPNRPEGLIRPGTPGTLAATRAYPDSGGLDVVLTSAREDRVVRITSRPGDDFATAWSPDGHYLAIATDRWADHSRSDLALLNPDQPDSAPRRLTRDPAARDYGALWSPDGTRIAFVRASYGDPPYELCLVTVDGHSERCLHLPGRTGQALVGWMSAVEIAGLFTDSGGVTEVLAVNTETGVHHELAEGLAGMRSHVGGWTACFCRRSAAEPYQTLVFAADRPDRAVRIESDDPPLALNLFPSRRPRSYLDRLKIEGAEQPIPVDGQYQLGLRGWDAAGRPIEPLAVRWISGDTTILAVDSLGTLRPRQEGRATVTATAGGWRSTSAEVTIGPGEAVTRVVEDWREGISETWVPFGDPRPFVAETDRGPALAPNGDSTFLSGVYLRRGLPMSAGVGVELDVSTPLTSLVWQNLNVALSAATASDVSTWDLERGNLHMSNREWRECRAVYPATESEAGQRTLGLVAGVGRTVSLPSAMADGRWTRVRLQVFPNGRCGVAIDGVARAIVNRRASLGDSAILLIQSYSHRTRILVGPLEVWTCVRRDVNWDVVER
jgi:hypothetical protein